MIAPAMTLALALAQRQQGLTCPNPAVGCVLVKDGLVIGQGATARQGRPHAEISALRMAGTQACNATVYVTLEPCSHPGKSGVACADALVEAGVSKVIISCLDPNPLVMGQGVQRLQAAGTLVEHGMGKSQALALNQGFFSRMLRKRPYIAAKIASSIDGRIALQDGKSQWITGQQARSHGHFLRKSHEAILIGTQTALLDQPALTCRLPGVQGADPIKIILDRTLTLPADHPSLPGAMLVTTAENAIAAEKKHLESRILSVALDQTNKRLDLHDLAQQLGQMGINSLLIEGGGQVISAALQADLVDSVHCYQAGKFIGATGKPAIGDLNLPSIPLNWRVQQIQPLGADYYQHLLAPRHQQWLQSLADQL